MRVGREDLPKLFVSFLRLGLTAFGGPAMVAYIRELAVKKSRLGHGRVLSARCHHVSVQTWCTAMQVAVYVGLRTRGPLGAMATYVGFGLPAFLALRLKVDILWSVLVGAIVSVLIL